MKQLTKTTLFLSALVLITAANAQGMSADNNEGLTAIGKGIALGLGAVGTGLAQAKIGTSIVGAVAENPSVGGSMLLYFLLPETLVLFGFVSLFVM